MDDITRPEIKDRKLWQRTGIGLAVVGFLILLLGADPGFYGLRDSEPVGIVQIGVFVFGLLLMCLGGYLAVDSLWKRPEKTILAELGVRTMSTGFIFAMVAALADLFGLGTRPFPGQTFFGHWQARGVVIGELAIIIGLLMMVPYPQNKPLNQETE
jgi:hypothetical protein